MESKGTWRQRNPEKFREQRRRHYWQPAVREASIALKREKRQDAAVREHEASRALAWQLNNPAAAAANKRAYRQGVRRARTAWSVTFFMDETYRLAKLRTRITGFPWEVDHVVPLRGVIVCGLHCEANLQVVPRGVNKAKGNRVWPDMPVENRHGL